MMTVRILAVGPRPEFPEFPRMPRLRPDVEFVESWLDVKRRLLSTTPPSGLIVHGSQVNADACEAVRLAASRGMLVPTVILMDAIPPAHIAHALECLASPWIRECNGDLAGAMDFMSNASVLALCEHITKTFDLKSPVLIKFLHTLASSSDVQRRPMHAIAAELGIGRTTLFARCAAVRLPAPDAVRALIRLGKGACALGRGSTIEDAAALAGYSDEKALRRALQHWLDLRIADLRVPVGWPTLLTRWLAHQPKRAGR